MAGVDDYLTVNRRNWDERVPIHAAAGSQYDLDLFRSDPRHLSRVVRFDRPRLGDVTGARGLHLQCHIGTDTLSLARLGARMSGLDFSPPALDVARRLAADTGAEIDYREADAYDAVEVFGRESFDLLYTGVGAICWLPNIDRWAEVVAGLLRPGGRLFLREGHPMLWALDETVNPPVLRYPYFEPAEALVFDEPTSYAGDGTPLANSVSHNFTHGLGETVAALLANGMRLTRLDEHDSVPWEALPGLMTCDDAGEWRLTEKPERLAASYTIEAVKEGSVQGRDRRVAVDADVRVRGQAS